MGGRILRKTMVEMLTAIAAVIGAVGSVTAGFGVLIVNGKIDRLTGRVDAIESTMQTVLTLIAGRPAAAVPSWERIAEELEND